MIGRKATRFSLALRQLLHEKRRLVAAAAGVAFAVILMLVQIGFYYAMIDSATNIHRSLAAEVVIVPEEFEYYGSEHDFDRARLVQALGVPGVRDVLPVYLTIGRFKNVDTGHTRSIICLAIDPGRETLNLAAVREQQHRLKLGGHALFDRKSLAVYFGDVPGKIEREGSFRSVVFDETVMIDGLFDLGTSVVAFGTVLMGTQTYFALNGEADPRRVNIGLVQLEPGQDPVEMRRLISERLGGGDVRVMTRDEFVQSEIDYWNNTAAIGFLFIMGAFMGFLVGAVIVYQILYTNVTNHLPEYATLKAMGYPHFYFVRLVLKQSVYLSLIGFIPGALVSHALYVMTAMETGYTMSLTPEKLGGILVATILMCFIAGLFAIRRLKQADPAELFS
jgi:putative ABC transport system permease protein